MATIFSEVICLLGTHGHAGNPVTWRPCRRWASLRMLTTDLTGEPNAAWPMGLDCTADPVAQPVEQGANNTKIMGAIPNHTHRLLMKMYNVCAIRCFEWKPNAKRINVDVTDKHKYPTANNATTGLLILRGGDYGKACLVYDISFLLGSENALTFSHGSITALITAFILKVTDTCQGTVI